MILVLTGIRNLSTFQEVELTSFSSLYKWQKGLSIIKSKGNKKLK